MIVRHFLKWTVCLLFYLQFNQCMKSVLIMTPHEWFCDDDAQQSVMVDFLDQILTSNYQLRITITDKMNSENSFHFSKKIDSNSLIKIDFTMPERLKRVKFNLTADVIDQNGEVEFSKTNLDISCKENTNGIYIITDKALYRASEKVNIRIVSIDSHLKPTGDNTASVFIIDPKGNYVQQNLELKFVTGLIDGLNFKLTNKPIYGTWTIKLIFKSNEYVKNFLVKEYVLPKVMLKVDINRYLIRSNPILEGQIEAKYTYGKGADGIVKINLKERFFVTSVVPNEEIVFSYKLLNGKLNFTENLVLNKIRGYYEALVTFIDQYSGENITQTVMLDFIQTEYSLITDSYQFEFNKTNTLNIITNWVSSQKPYSHKAFKCTLNQKINYSAESNSIESILFHTDLNGSAQIEFKVSDENTTFVEILFHPIADENQITRIYLYKKSNEISDEKPLGNHESTNTSLDQLNITLMNQEQAITRESILDFRISRLQNDQECYIARYLVVSRLTFVDSQFFELCDENDIQIKLNQRFGPYSSLIVYYLDKNNNVTTATYQFELSQATENFLDISFETDKVRPGDLVNLAINTKEYSYISLCIIDKSLELIEETNELTADQLNQQIDQLKLNPYFQANYFAKGDYYFPRFWEKPKAMIDFNNEGIVVLSNLESLESTLTDVYPVFQNFEMQSTHHKEEISYGGSIEKNDQIRKDFREIWIWNTYQNGEKQNLTISSIIPDTITSWIVSGFSLNEKYGLALANKSQVTTFKPFFVSMILPSSLTRGEILPLKVVVFNYFDFDLNNVSIEFLKTEDFTAISGESKEDNTIQMIDSIPAGQAHTVEYVVTPQKIGLLKLSSRAICEFAGDTEQRFIKVKAEGLEQSEVISNLINLNNTNYTLNEEIFLPKNIVNQSESCYLQFIGDFLGTAFNNLNKLINRPYGCGEQNMLDLTPNIYALKYLYSLKSSKISNLDKLIVEAKDNIVYGYQNELKYARKDGSFSAFGESDPSGSSWLTSFVLKSFSQADQFVNIDKNVISKAAEWVIGQQRPDGSFNEPGRVIHKEMQGGVNSNQTITAYITISLLESNLESRLISKSIKKSISYLEKNTNLGQNDSYSTSLVSYALALAKNKRFIRSTKSVKKNNIEIENLLITDEEDKSSGIEAASYRLLTNLLNKNMDESVQIARSLVSKSNSLGSYSSTQNTVLALQALSEFALQFKFSEENSVKVSIFLNSDNFYQLDLNEENKLILQQIQLPKCSGNLRIESTGYGSVLIQIIKNYNLLLVPENKNRIFEIKQEFLDRNDRILNIETCARSLNETGMVIIESEIFAGFETNKLDLDIIPSKNSLIKLAETNADNTKVAFYLDKLEFEWTCVNWKLYKIHEIQNLKPVLVKVYDYYNIETEHDIFFKY